MFLNNLIPSVSLLVFYADSSQCYIWERQGGNMYITKITAKVFCIVHFLPTITF